MPRMFDRPATYNPSEAPYSDLQSRATVQPGYTPRQPGMLSTIGNVGQAMLQPWLAAYGQDTGFMARQAELQQKQEMADMEFQKFLVRNQGQATGNFITTDEDGKLVVAGQRSKGDVFIDPMRTMTPDQRSDVKTRGQVKSDLGEKAPIINSLLGALDRMDELIEKSKDYKTGLVNATGAKADVKIKELSNDPLISEYTGYLSQNLSPLARQVQTEKGPLTDRDIDRITKGIGRIDQPRSVRRNLTKEIRTKLKEQMDATLQGAGYTTDDLKKLYPEIHDRLYKSNSFSKEQESLINNYEEKYKNRSREEIIKAMKKAGKL